MSLTLILAVLLDHWLGEPQKYHPLVFFGDLAHRIEKKLSHTDSSVLAQRIFGLIALIIMVSPMTGLIYLLSQWDLVNLIISPIVLYFCIAANSLKQHATNVLTALELNDLALAQTRVGWIVSRQTEKMNEEDVRKATIESVLENGADAVFAPVFWFIVAGPAGAILYRLSNTLDAMWGYKNPRYLYFGWAAARFDDVLNWVPARLTALSYALLGQTRLAIHCWKNQAHLLDSPNAGPVMTSGAGALNLQLGGPTWYHGKLKAKIFFGTDQPSDNQSIKRANSLVTSSLYLWIFVLILGETLA
ncbi:MAG: cobalamin biosynthesis protein [Methylomarinum sp.]|nr:cobalamin biosynthesis protein [Methylomarinum sp.]